MELTMNQAVLGVERSGIRVFTQLARQTPGCMTLTLGEPDFDTAPAIRAAAKAALDQGDTHYPENNGRPWLKEAIADFEARRSGLSYRPEEVIVTVGATEGIFAALFAILNPGDEVIIPTPAFGLYEYIVQMCRGVPVKVPTERTGFQLTEEALRSALTPRTKAVILTSPNNPTGRSTPGPPWRACGRCCGISRCSCCATRCTVSCATTAPAPPSPPSPSCGTGSW